MLTPKVRPLVDRFKCAKITLKCMAKLSLQNGNVKFELEESNVLLI